MPIHIPTIINELRENATEEQRKGLSILDSRFYECIELKNKLEIATKALERIEDLASDNDGINDGGIIWCALNALKEMKGVK